MLTCCLIWLILLEKVMVTNCRISQTIKGNHTICIVSKCTFLRCVSPVFSVQDLATITFSIPGADSSSSWKFSVGVLDHRIKNTNTITSPQGVAVSKRKHTRLHFSTYTQIFIQIVFSQRCVDLEVMTVTQPTGKPCRIYTSPNLTRSLHFTYTIAVK